MDEKIREAVEELNRRLPGHLPYRLEAAAPKDIRLQEKNARYMTNEMFMNLVENIKRDGNMTSLPLCVRELDGGLRVISGNHRVQAAIKAGVEMALVLVLTAEITHEEEVAIQLSHNAIAGKDDPVMLRELWSEIEDIGLKIYAGLDTETIKQLEAMQFDSIADARLDFKTITLLFLPEEEEALREILDKADEAFSGDSVYLLSKAHFAKVFDVVVKAKEGYNIVNNPTALLKLIELADAAMDGLNPDVVTPQKT